MSAGPRFAFSKFSVFTYTKLENTDIQNSDFPKVGQHKEVCVRHMGYCVRWAELINKLNVIQCG